MLDALIEEKRTFDKETKKERCRELNASDILCGSTWCYGGSTESEELASHGSKWEIFETNVRAFNATVAR